MSEVFAWSPLLCPKCLADRCVVRLVYAHQHDLHLCCDCDYALAGQVLFEGMREAA